MMKKLPHRYKIFYCISALIPMILIFSFRLNAQTPRSLLWEISGNGLTQHSYLDGTIHVICKKDMIISRAFKTAFDSAEVAYIEMNPSAFKISNREKTLEQLRSVPSAASLLSKKDDRKLVRFTKKNLNIDEAKLSKMDLMSLTGLLYRSLLHCDSIKSFEEYIISRATSDDQPIGGIETIGDQVKAFNKVYLKSQSKQLMHIVSHYDKESKIYQSYVASYKKQDLLKLSQGNKAAFHRNTNWIPKMISIMKRRSAFFAFGAGHLAGQQGLISLLREYGYRVEPAFS